MKNYLFVLSVFLIKHDPTVVSRLHSGMSSMRKNQDAPRKSTAAIPFNSHYDRKLERFARRLPSLDNQGTDFLFGFLPNFNSDGLNLELHLTGSTHTTVTIEYPMGTPIASTDVIPGNVTIVQLSSAAATGWTANQVTSNLVRANAEKEFIAYMVNRKQDTSDAALGLPIDTMNTDYVVLDYYSASLGIPSELLVYAAYNDTTVSITPASSLGGGQPAKIPFSVTLNSGEGYFATSRGTLTGSIIWATRPIGMTNGNQCVIIPNGVYACDHIFEVAHPVQTWGLEIGVANLPKRSESIYRVVSFENNTTVTLDGNLLATLNRGSFHEISLTGNHVFRGDTPIFVVQFMTGSSAPGAIDGDPAQGNMIPFAQYLTNYTFSTVGGNQFSENFVTIIAEKDDLVNLRLDGTPVDVTLFSIIPTTNFSAAVIPLSQGTHVTTSKKPHGITVEGYNDYDSYLYPGGALFEFINPVGDANVPLITTDPLNCDSMTVSGLAWDNKTSEDVNSNGVLDAGEDINGNGQIDKDTGIFFIKIREESTNLNVTARFEPGAPQVQFVVSRVDGSSDATGTIVVTDGAGNENRLQVTISSQDCKSTPPMGDANVPLITTDPLNCDSMTVSGLAWDNKTSEDVNSNLELDAGEDINGNGQIDKDTGIFSIKIREESTNLNVTARFEPGAPQVQFVVSRVDGSSDATGTIVVTDGAGNENPLQVTISSQDCKSTPPVDDLCEAYKGCDVKKSSQKSTGSSKKGTGNSKKGTGNSKKGTGNSKKSSDMRAICHREGKIYNTLCLPGAAISSHFAQHPKDTCGCCTQGKRPDFCASFVVVRE